VPLNSDIHLRNYQIEGITWLGFLCKYNLNGALCDDMGLGKTLQVLILIENEYQKLLKERD
jgi:TATA-binding protein-associated factor